MDYGTVTFEGKTYQLQEQPELSNRVLQHRTNFNDALDGEEYDFEMSALATDDEGKEYEVCWIFTDMKGNEKPELTEDYFGFDDVAYIKER